MPRWASLIAGMEYGTNNGMENGMERRTYTVAANLCNWRCSVEVELPCVSLGLLSHCRSFYNMSNYAIAHRHASLS